MEVRCDQCQARYRVDDTRVGPKGLAMRCGKCGNTFRLARDGTVTKTAPTKGPGIPTPGTATPLATVPGPPRKTDVPGGEGPGGTVVLQPPAQTMSEPAAKPAPAETPAASPVSAAPSPFSLPASSPATPSAAASVPLSAPPSPRTSAATPVPRDDASVPSSPPRESSVDRPPASAPARKVQRPPRSMQMEGAPK